MFRPGTLPSLGMHPAAVIPWLKDTDRLSLISAATSPNNRAVTHEVLSTTKVKAVIYARVSTGDQRNEIQVRELTEYVARREWELTGVYQDTMSGAKAKRPGLDSLPSG